MKNKINILNIISALVLLVFCQAYVSAAPQLAVASGKNGIYILRSEGTWQGDRSYVKIYNSGISGVAVKGSTIYGVDSTNNRIVVGTITNALDNPKIENLKYVDLANMQTPDRIAVNDNGGVYVTSSKVGNGNNFAYLYASGGDWSTPNISYGTSNISISDVTKYSSGAYITGVNTSVGGSDKPTAVASLVGNNVLNARNIEGSLAGRTVAVYSDTVAYVGSGDHMASDIGAAQGRLDVVNPGTGNVLQSFLFDSDLDPQDLMTYVYGDKHYLFVVGKPNDKNGVSGGPARAWSYEIDSANGHILTESKTNQIIWSQEERYGQQCAVSSDGSLIWTTHVSSTGPTVLAYSTAIWGSTIGNFADTSDLGLHYISAFDYNIVPEPSSIIALFSMSAGAFAIFKRKKA